MPVQSQRILVTGGAGFIGYFLVKRILETIKDVEVVTIDNLNAYYSQQLKLGRLHNLGITCGINKAEEIPWNEPLHSRIWPKLTFQRVSLEDAQAMTKIFDRYKFDYVVNLAAQAGVRYSLENPRSYILSNIDGFLNVLEGCRATDVKHLVYASSSSVYGLNGKIPFNETDNVDHPVSLYAATKKSNELMAHVYSHIYGIPTTGLRFFTVYGPWGRPDMSPYLFIDAILNDKEIKVFNKGEMQRDFTYIDDIVQGIMSVLLKIPVGDKNWDNLNPNPSTSNAPYRIYNIGNSSPVNLMDYITIIEECTGKKAKKIMMPMQPGDVYRTYSDSSLLQKATGFSPSTDLQKGITNTVEWFKQYHGME